MNNDLVKVAQGQIHVNDIGLIKTEPGIFVFTVDCKAKRFEIGGSVKDYGTNELSTSHARARFHGNRPAYMPAG